MAGLPARAARGAWSTSGLARVHGFRDLGATSDGPKGSAGKQKSLSGPWRGKKEKQSKNAPLHVACERNCFTGADPDGLVPSAAGTEGLKCRLLMERGRHENVSFLFSWLAPQPRVWH